MRRPLSPTPVYRDFTEQGRLEKLTGYWQRMTNQADIVVEVGPREVDFTRELGQVAIIKENLDAR